RESGWFVDRVKKYHRTFSTIINTLIEEGFAIERIAEPVPTEEQMRLYPSHADLMHRPDFLLVRAKKD
ncbi:MAG: class I SAM-dependent methyltransferase, partial [Firmicutes bacterium]|nr:class I SAM-dependent methyltransferase [Bacillota bacterium]